MRRFLLALVIVVASLGAFTGQADAHNFDSLSLSTCYQERTPGWNLILHSHPVAIIPGIAIDYGCLQTDGVRCQHYFATYWANFATSRHDDSAWYIC